MSDKELQNDSVDAVKTEETVIEDQNTGAALATASESEHENQPKVEESAEAKAKKAQLAVEKVINTKTFETKQAERERDELQGKLNAIEKEKQESLAKSFKDAPAMPVMPNYPTTDPFDDKHEQDVRKYHEDVATYNANMPLYHQQVQDKATFDAQQTTLQEQQKSNQQQEEQQRALKMQESQIAYRARSNELGIKPEELQAAGNAVSHYGLSNDLVMHILSDKEGPLITKHLAANPQDGFSLASMNPYNVGELLNGIKVKAVQLKQKTTNTPEPVDQLVGAGAQLDLNKFPNSGRGKIT